MAEETNSLDQETKLAQELTRSIRHFNRCHHPEVINENIKPKGMMLLHYLHHKKRHGHTQVTLSSIGEELRLSPPSVTLLLNPLEKHGYLKRVRDLEDRRVVFAEISEKGSKAVQELYEQFLHNAKVMVHLLGEEDTRTFIDLMNKLTRLFRAYKDEQKQETTES